MLSNLGSRSGGVHVAEEVLDPSKGDTTALVAHLQTGESVRKEERLPAVSTWPPA